MLNTDGFIGRLWMEIGERSDARCTIITVLPHKYARKYLDDDERFYGEWVMRLNR